MDQQTEEKKPKIHNTEPSHWPKTVVEIGRTFGVPTLLLLIICYWLVFQITPPIVAGMSSFLASTMETQRELAKTQADIADSQRKLVMLIEDVQAAAAEIVIAEKSTQTFMAKVEQDHATQLQKLDTIENAVTKPTP